MVGVVVVIVGAYAAVRIGVWTIIRYDSPGLGVFVAMAIVVAAVYFVARWYE